MLTRKFSLILIITIILTLGLSISLGSLLAAWTAPSSAPPDGNVAALLNTSATGQAKQGGLIFNTGGSANGLIVQFGNVGIGTTNPQAKLSFGDINDGRDTPDGITWYSGSPLTYGIYRTSGAWSAPNYQQLQLSFATGIVIDGGSAYGKSGTVLQPNGGNVGIGTTDPKAALHIEGGLILGDYSVKPTCGTNVLGMLVFDTTEGKPYVCNGSVWKPLDSDYDKDGIVDWNDWDDTNASKKHPNLIVENIKSGVTIFSVTGNYSAPSPPNCTDNNTGECYITQATKSALDTDLAAGNIKSGVNIFGVAGNAAIKCYTTFHGNPGPPSGCTTGLCQIGTNCSSRCFHPNQYYWSIIGTDTAGVVECMTFSGTGVLYSERCICAWY